ncbi:hypothetical protein JDV02_009019 [Purpureocillium takamizusanense]|uniref:Uncharacterized protein n=1 Tax=Purpureocillium takamizusanense TaxID=2060973 RepID=A0A9Q8QNX1_9HYPO|nr:uncharacterized protein JDV02_009019 [Purpureocillium takamizusanense]UNI23185.1 hypothetical protein JDV02_009019 [Purpureocillium takamizusanense]
MLQGLFANYISSLFPNITDSLRLRLASSVVLRRRRILYRRSRYGDSPIRAKKTVSQPQIDMPQSQRQDPLVLDLADEAAPAPVVEHASAKSIVRSLAPSATTLAVEDYRKASTPSVISAAKTVALEDHEDLNFPPPPNGRVKGRYKVLTRQRWESHQEYLNSLPNPFQLVNDKSVTTSPYLDSQGNHVTMDTLVEHFDKVNAAKRKLKADLHSDWNECHKIVPELICPFCLYALPSLSISDDEQWRAHITNDLHAYVCLFDECDKPEELHRHSSDWLQHMRMHTLRWRCNSKSHGAQTFLTEEQYLRHMRGVHTGCFTEPQLRALAERNARPIGPMFTLCPICGATEATDTLEAHIVGHLRGLALRSLPPFEDVGSESSKENGSGASRPMSRSTIKNDRDRYTTPSFADVGGNWTWDFDTPDPSSPYARSGGYRNYIAAISDDAGSGRQNAPPGSHFVPPDSIDAENEFSATAGSFSDDPSSRFVEGSLFDGIRTEDRMNYEWGFTIRAGDKNLENDHVVRSMLDYKRRPKRQARHSVEKSDLRLKHITEAVARQVLSSIVVIRHEKLNNPNEVDEEGYPWQPSWERVTRTEEADGPLVVLNRVLHKLAMDGPVADKKAKLSSLIQQQLEETHALLEEKDPDRRYRYILAQLDWKVRNVDKSTFYFKTEMKSKSKKDGEDGEDGKDGEDGEDGEDGNDGEDGEDGNDGEDGKKDEKPKASKMETAKSSKSKSKSKSKTRKKRASVTAYFKRVPKDSENALKMLEELLESKITRQQPSSNHSEEATSLSVSNPSADTR